MIQSERSFETAVQKHQAGRIDEAIADYRVLLDDQPDHPDLQRLLGVALLQSGNIDEAIATLRQAVEAHPQHAATHCNLGSALRAARKPGEAEAAFREAVALDPNLAEAHNNLGSLAMLQGKLDEAADHYRSATELAPQSAIAQANLAGLMLTSGAHGEALQHARRALDNDPDLPGARKLHACALYRTGQLEAAARAFQDLVEAGRADPATLNQYGNLLEDQGRWPDALEAQQQALALDAEHGPALSDALFLARRLCRWDDHGPLLERFRAGLQAGCPGLKPFTLLSEWSSPAEQRDCGRLWARQFRTRSDTPRLSGDTLTVGYVSSGFRRHPTGCLTAELFARHRREEFRWIGYSTGPDDGSELRRRIAEGLDVFHDVSNAGDQQIAERIRGDGVDILIDLRGYGGGAVTEVFARRPAPIQVNWLAYPGTLGADFMDYIIVDPHVAPDSVAAGFDEAPVYLPACYQPTDTTREIPDPPQRAAAGLPSADETIVFCCFNNSYKISERIFEAWMKILSGVPDSVMWLLDGPPGAGIDETLRGYAERFGIANERLVFAPKAPHAEYLARYRLADLFLDTLPYNAHTTASDALWAGCPVLTTPGDTFAGRVATSLNRNAGCEALVTDDLESYVDLAVALGRDRGRLKKIRERLVEERATWPLFRTIDRARELEAAYREMAARHRRGEKPARIEIG